MPDSLEMKVDAVVAAVNRMEPMLGDVRSGQKDAEIRLRAVEVNIAAHTVKIERIQTDLDGLGRKVRHIEMRPPGPPTAPSAEVPGRWAAVAEFLGAIPAYWHAIGYVAAGVLSVAAIIARHK